MKIAFLKQLKLNRLTSDILNDLIQSYKHSKISEASFVKQVGDTGQFIGKMCMKTFTMYAKMRSTRNFVLRMKKWFDALAILASSCLGIEETTFL